MESFISSLFLVDKEVGGSYDDDFLSGVDTSYQNGLFDGRLLPCCPW